MLCSDGAANAVKTRQSEAVTASTFFQPLHPHAVQHRSESGKRKIVNMQALAKIQVAAIFLKQDTRRQFLPRCIEFCMETPCCCPSRCAPTWLLKINRNHINVTEFCYESVNLSLGELKNINIIQFLKHKQFTRQISRNKSLLYPTWHLSRSRPPCKCQLINPSAVYHKNQ